MICVIISFILSMPCAKECVGRKSRYRRMQFGTLGNGFGNTGSEGSSSSLINRTENHPTQNTKE
jgi:hypothetical protein